MKTMKKILPFAFHRQKEQKNSTTLVCITRQLHMVTIVAFPQSFSIKSFWIKKNIDPSHFVILLALKVRRRMISKALVKYSIYARMMERRLFEKGFIPLCIEKQSFITRYIMRFSWCYSSSVQKKQRWLHLVLQLQFRFPRNWTFAEITVEGK